MSSPKRPSAPPVPAPSNPVLVATQSQWLFTDSELHLVPSVLDGMSLEQEQTNRAKGVRFISEVGILLKLPQLTLATASVYLHRFFMRYSMVDLHGRAGMHPYAVAATALFLATKVEENCRKLRELIIACCRVAQKQPSIVIDEQSKEFWKWRDTILHNEDVLLEALCFDLQLEQPYRLLYDFMGYFGVKDNKPLRNAGWAFVNDSAFTVLCVQFPARTIAGSALYAAARHCGIAFKDDRLGRPWWEQIDVDIKEVRRACNRMAELYERHPTPDPNRKYPTTPVNGEPGEAVDKTRHVRNLEQAVQSNETSASQSPSEPNGRKRDRLDPSDEMKQANGSAGNSSSQPVRRTEPSPKRQKLDSNEPDNNKPEPTTSLSSSFTQPQSSQATTTSPAAQDTAPKTTTTTTTATQPSPPGEAAPTKQEPSTTQGKTAEEEKDTDKRPSPPPPPTPATATATATAKDNPGPPSNSRIPAAAREGGTAGERPVPLRPGTASKEEGVRE